MYFTEPFDPNPTFSISKGEGGGRIGNEEKIQHNIQYKPVSINGNIYLETYLNSTQSPVSSYPEIPFSTYTK